MIFVLEFSATVPGTEPVTRTFLVGTEAFTTGPADTPASTSCLERLSDPGNFSRSIAANRVLFGVTEAQGGEAVFENGDGKLDDWVEYGVGGTATLRCAAYHPGTYPAGWETVYVARADGWVSEASGSRYLKLRLRELLSRLDKPMCGVFAGTGGLEGGAALEGVAKPKLFGAAYNVSPVLIDASEQIWMVSSRGSVMGNHAKDRGSVIARALTAGDDGDATTVDADAVETFAALQSASVPIGHYITHASTGTLKLGSVPIGSLTVDAIELTGPDTGVAYGTGDRWTAGDTGTPGTDLACTWWNVIKAIAIDAGWDPADIEQDDLDAIAAKFEADRQYGYWAQDLTTTYLQAIGAIAASVGAVVYVDRLGKLRVRTVYSMEADTAFGVTPTDPVVMTIDENNVIAGSLAMIASNEPGRGVPFGRVLMRYPRNWTVQRDAAGAVPAKVLAQISQEWPLTKVGEGDASAVYENASDLVVDVYSAAFRATTDGGLQAETTGTVDGVSVLQKLVDLLCVYRYWLTVKVKVSFETLTTLDIGSNVLVQLPQRYGLSDGHIFRVLGLRPKLGGDPYIELTLWGGEAQT